MFVNAELLDNALLINNDSMSEKQKQKQENDFTYIAIYFLTFITGIIFYLISKDDKRKRQHSIQAIVLGAVMVIIGLIPFVGGVIDILIWLYGLYIGYKASVNEDVAIYITDFAKKYV